MKISKAHQKLSKLLNNPRVLEHPEEFLGPNWKAVLNFWLFLDTLISEQWEIIENRYQELNLVHRDRAYAIVCDRSESITQYNVPAAFSTINQSSPIRGAAYEFICSHELNSMFFLPLFLNL